MASQDHSKDNGTFCGEPLLGLSLRGIGTVQQCSQIKYIKGIPKKGTVDGLNTNDGLVYIDGQPQELFNLKYDKWEDVWNSEYLVDLRNKQAKGVKNPTCELCYHQNKKSKRYRYVDPLYQSRDWSKVYNDEVPYKIELRLSNECNLACRMCTPINSSIFEKNMLKFDRETNETIPDFIQKAYVEPSKFVNDLKKQDVKFIRDKMDSIRPLIESATILEIHGGEPTLETTLWDILEEIDLSNKEFIMYTNAMTFNQYHVDILNRFKSGRIGFSVDTCDESLSYHRWPADWKTIENNILTYGKNLKQDIIVNFKITISVYTMFRLRETIRWTLKHFKDDPRFEPSLDIVNKPAWLNPNLIDFDIRQKLVTQLKDLLAYELDDCNEQTKKLYNRRVGHIFNHLSINDMYNSIPDKTGYSMYKPNELNKVIYEQFKTFTATMDKARKQNFYEALPEFKGIL